MPGIKIDENKHKPERSLLLKIAGFSHGMIFGPLIVQVVLFWFSTRSIFLLYNTSLFLFYLAGCGILGWLYGNNFTDLLHAKIIDWWY